MRKLTTVLLLGPVLVASVMAAPALYAQGGREPSGSMMDHGMMENRDGQNEGGMMGMMKMMKQMSEMADHCSNMMSDGRPNEQWRKNAPSESEKKE